VKARAKALASLESKDLTETLRAKMLVLLEIGSPSSKLSAETTYNLLYDYIEAAASTNKNLEKYNHYFELLKTAEGKVRFETTYMLRLAQALRIIFAKQDTWTWIRESGATLVIGDRFSEAVDFLMDPKKSTEFEELQNQIKAKQ